MNRTRLGRVLLITASWIAISLVLFLASHTYFVASTAPGSPPDTYRPLVNLVGYVGSSLIGGLLFGYVLVFRSERRARGKRFSFAILYSAGLFVVAYAASVAALTLLIALGTDVERRFGALAATVWSVLTTPASLTILVVWSLVVAGTQFVLQVNDKFGQGILWDFLTGRYHRPREEPRTFMFLDLKGSTTLAERIGHERYFEFIRDFVQDVTDPILRWRGEIYQYVGDEIVVSWRSSDPVQNADCVRCYFAIVDRMASLEERYQERYGACPEFRAGLHYGRVTVGEIGVIRKDIVFSGDVLNTASRIQGECSRLGEPLLASSDVLDTLLLDDAYRLETLGVMELRGRENRIELHAIRRA